MLAAEVVQDQDQNLILKLGIERKKVLKREIQFLDREVIVKVQKVIVEKKMEKAEVTVTKEMLMEPKME